MTLRQPRHRLFLVMAMCCAIALSVLLPGTAGAASATNQTALSPATPPAHGPAVFIHYGSTSQTYRTYTCDEPGQPHWNVNAGATFTYVGRNYAYLKDFWFYNRGGSRTPNPIVIKGLTIQDSNHDLRRLGDAVIYQGYIHTWHPGWIYIGGSANPESFAMLFALDSGMAAFPGSENCGPEGFIYQAPR